MEGLNLISLVMNSSVPLTSHDILNGQPNGISGCTKVMMWNTSTGSWDISRLFAGIPTGPEFPIETGYGYFIQVDADVDWTPAAAPEESSRDD